MTGRSVARRKLEHRHGRSWSTAMGAIWRDFNAPAFWAGVSTLLFFLFGGLTLQISVIQQFDLPAAQAQSWIVVTWLTTGVASLVLIVRYRQPLGIGWTLPGLVYMGSLAGRFTFEEFAGANAVAGVLLVILGLFGIGGAVVRAIPLPILMGMFAASVIGYITRMVDATAEGVAIAAPMLVAYLAGRVLDRQRVPPVGLAVVAGGVAVAARGLEAPAMLDAGMPALVAPGLAFSIEAFLTITVPMVVLVLGLGNVQGMGFLMSQGYRVPATTVTVTAGAMTVANALFGGHPASMIRVASAMLGGPEAGPHAQRYWAAIVAFVPVTAIGLATGAVVAVVAVLPPVYSVTVAGLAILASFEDALKRAFGGPLNAGATVAFAVTFSTFTVAGIPSAFWALLAGIGASLLLERRALLDHWRPQATPPEGAGPAGLASDALPRPAEPARIA